MVPVTWSSPLFHSWSPIYFTLLPRISDVFCCCLGSQWFHLKPARNDRQVNPLQRTSCLVLFSSKSYYVVLKSVERFEKSACMMRPCALGRRLPKRPAFMINADRKLQTQSTRKYIQIAKRKTWFGYFYVKQLSSRWQIRWEELKFWI